MSPLASQEHADAVRVHGALGAALLEIERLKAELAGECAHTALSLIYSQERDDALAEVKRLTRVTQVIMATGDADHERLSNLLHLTLDERNERDATIELVRALVEDPHAALVVDRIRAALEESS